MEFVSIILLTYNSEESLPATLESAQLLSDDIHAVDSYSTDGTVEILKRFNVNWTQRRFENYSEQRNWSIDNLPVKAKWQLHLDADEVLSPELVLEIKDTLRSAEAYDGYFIPRRIRFLGKDLRFGGFYPIYHMRLFKKGHARVEERLYDQHFILSGRGRTLSHPFIDDHRSSISEWTARHNRWSDFEASELVSSSPADEAGKNVIQAAAFGNVLERKRANKQGYLAFPILLRPFLLFLYRYVFRLGFLDGREGLIYCVLQTFWFRFLVDAKVYEAHMRARERAGEKKSAGQ